MIEVKQVERGSYPQGTYLCFPADHHLEGALARFVERFHSEPEEYFILLDPPGAKGLYVGPIQDTYSKNMPR